MHSVKGSFADFIFPQHRTELWIGLGILAVQFICIKTLFPYAIITGDANQYIRTAANNVELTAWPIGYPKFLEWVHLLAKGGWLLVTLQYILLEGAILWFYFTVRYLLQPGKWVSRLIYFCLLMNPFILCISNYAQTDSLFTALSVAWFTLILWHLYKPRPVYIFGLVILAFLPWTIRYSAMFYPLITLPVILFSGVRWWVKLSGVITGCLLFWGFVLYTENLYQQLIGRKEFSPYSGWQLAGNALIMYRHIEHREADIPPPELLPLHQLVLHDLDNLPAPDQLPDKELHHFFTWKPISPLVRYCQAVYGTNPSTETLRKWASAGQLYHKYGVFLIKRHPLAYFRYYGMAGVAWFISPDDALTNVFPKGGVLTIDRSRDWFGYPSNWLPCSTSSLYSVTFIPVFANILNLLFILCIPGYFICGCHRTASPLINKAVVTIAIYWLINFIFIVLSAPFQNRYGLPAMIFNTAFVPMLIERICKA